MTTTLGTRSVGADPKQPTVWLDGVPIMAAVSAAHLELPLFRSASRWVLRRDKPCAVETPASQGGAPCRICGAAVSAAHL